MKVIKYTLAILFVKLIIINLVAVGQNNTCSFNSLGGDRHINYDEFYTEIFNSYTNYSNNNSNFIKNLAIRSAKSYIEVCPSFYERLMKNELPLQKMSTGNNFSDLLANELLKNDPDYKKTMEILKREHPKIKRWLRGIK